jgi:RNA polymerase sigma-70 factor (ECF subfamily)
MQATELADVYRRCGATIYRRCLKLLGDRAAALDATQEVFIRFMTHANQLERGDGYLGWIYRVATNHCLNVLRDDARLIVCDPASLPEVAVNAATSGYADLDLSARLLRRFDETTRTVAILALVDGLTQDEVAEVMGLSRKTVGKKLNLFIERARRFVGGAA